MTITKRSASRFAGVIVAASALWAAVPAAGFAEPADNARIAPSAAAAARSGQPVATTPRAAVSPRVPGRTTQGRPWAIEDALPDKSSALNSSATPTPPPPELGRIPWQNGTLGVETKSQVNPYELPDGGRIRGTELTTQNKPSYLGLSLTVPSHDKLFQVPALPSFGSAVGGPQ
jgi:hypothetical protein